MTRQTGRGRSGAARPRPRAAAPLRILSIASEVAPYSKTGGLGDVAGSLPRALAGRGHDVLVIAPLVSSAVAAGAIANTGASVTVPFPDRAETAAIAIDRAATGARFGFLDHPGFFARSGLYGDADGDYPDNARRFAFLSRAALDAAHALGFAPDVVHAHDWQAALLPMLVGRAAGTARPRTVLTIHNLAFQGNFPAGVVAELGLSADAFTPDGYEFFGQASFLKAGLTHADAMVAVSPRYAREIVTPEFGCGLEGVLEPRRASLSGILNGIDDVRFDPARDDALPARFSAHDLAGRATCRSSLLEAFGMPAGAGPEPTFGMVTRLTEQKGIELLLAALPRLVALGPVVVLGNGDAALERALREAQRAHPRRLGVKIGFDDRLARRVFAGCDLYLMPSRFEPCGLAQMYALRYGAVPIVRAVGGLDDSVIDADRDPRRGTGFKFEPYTATALVEAAAGAARAFADRRRFAEIARRGMRADFSWRIAAASYEALYRRLLAGA